MSAFFFLGIEKHRKTNKNDDKCYEEKIQRGEDHRPYKTFPRGPKKGKLFKEHLDEIENW